VALLPRLRERVHVSAARGRLHFAHAPAHARLATLNPSSCYVFPAFRPLFSGHSITCYSYGGQLPHRAAFGTLKSRDGSLFPKLRPDRFGSKGGMATKRIGPRIRELASVMPSLADIRLSPSHSWRHIPLAYRVGSHRHFGKSQTIPQLHVSNGFNRILFGLGKNTPFPKLSQKRVSRCVREEGLRPHYGDHNVNVTCSPEFDGKYWREECRIYGKPENFWISP
jgi:hypothetical protein